VLKLDHIIMQKKIRTTTYNYQKVDILMDTIAGFEMSEVICSSAKK